MKLQILIPTLYSRAEVSTRLRTMLECFAEVNCLPDDGGLSIGEKRNALLQEATADYVCFVDDDDWVLGGFFDGVMKGIEKGVDCCSLRGVITTNNLDPKIFEHSIRYQEYKTTDNPIVYERYPNHLNVIKREIAQQFKFPEIDHGEDTDWATQLHKSGLLKTEHYIPDIIYHYDFKTNK